MKKLLVTLLTLLFLAVPTTALACPEGSEQIGGGAPGFPKVCKMRIEYTRLFYIFPWP